MLTRAYIPYGGYYSTPFARWQGSLAGEHAILLGASTSKRFFAHRGWDPAAVEYVLLGSTVYQKQWFYGGPWAAGLMGAEGAPGVLVSQACSTSTLAVWQAGMGVETGLFELSWCLLADRCSNGPHAVWPNPAGPGGQVVAEDWVMDNFNLDPFAGGAMIQTAENVAREAGLTREACDALVLRRQDQYRMALADDRAFQKRYMFPVEVASGRKQIRTVAEDEGIQPSTAEGLAGLRPVLPGGVHTFGSQTHPADGHCGLVVATQARARELSTDPAVEIRLVGYGYARERKGYMGAAVAPAARRALDMAGLAPSDLGAVKTHNPFASNDLVLAQALGLDAGSINNYGSSLIFGHPQAPTGARLVIEGIEELVLKGGGHLLFAGCAAGDTAAALVLRVG